VSDPTVGRLEKERTAQARGRHVKALAQFEGVARRFTVRGDKSP